jgi:zinc transport system substrate-binding protein
MRIILILLIIMVGTVEAAALGAPPGPISVVASFFPLADFARGVGGDRVAVRTLVPAGVEPHDYEARPRDIVALSRARVVIYNGAGFEPWLHRVLPQLPDHVTKVNATEGLPLTRLTTRGSRGVTDPHVWLDPLLAQRQVGLIVAGLSRADLGGRHAYENNGAAYAAKLDAQHRRIARAIEPCRQKVFVVAHASFGYFAARYGLKQIPISGVTPEEEPSAAKMREMLRLAREHRVTVIYYETLVSPRVAAALAREIGARTLVLNPLEGLTLEEQRLGKDYFTVMDENLRNLRQGLDCP